MDTKKKFIVDIEILRGQWSRNVPVGEFFLLTRHRNHYRLLTVSTRNYHHICLPLNN